MPRTFLLVLLSFWLTLASTSIRGRPFDMEGPRPEGQADYPPPRFADPDRRARLLSALNGIEPAIREQMDRMRAPGLSWGVIIDGELVRSGGMGVRDVAASEPVDADTVFRIASMTKSFTALAILKLRDEGKLSLDDPVGRHVPEFASVRLPTSDSPAITVRHLLTHSEGFPEDNPWGDRQLGVPDETLGAWLRQGLPFSTPPGTAYEYSNFGFALLGRIVANVAGIPYRDYMAASILRPLGMTTTTLEPAEVPTTRVATGYQALDGGWQIVPSLPHGSFGAMGGLLTSARDLGRYVSFMLSAWPPRDEEERGPVKRSSVREMQQGQRLANFSVTRMTADAPISASTRAYGYGLGATTDCRAALTVSHGGGLPGFGSNMTWLPDHGVGVIVMANRTYAPAAAVTRVILERLAASGGLRPRQVVPSPTLVRAHQEVAALLNAWGDARMQALAADNLFQDRALETRRDEFARIHDRVGTCGAPPGIDAENWLRGTARLSCERGSVTVDLTLAPTQPPRVQRLEITAAQPLSQPLTTSMDALASLAATWDEASAARVLAPESATTVRAQAPAIALHYGTCRAGEVLAGDGRTDARVRFDCERGRLDVHVEADESGRIRAASFRPPPDVTCVP